MNEQLVDNVVYHTFSFPCLTGEAKQEECDPRITRDADSFMFTLAVSPLWN